MKFLSKMKKLKGIFNIFKFIFKLIFNILVKKDEYSRFVIAEKISQMIYPRYKFSDFGRLFLYDDDFLHIYESFIGKKNYRTLDRKYLLDQLIKLSTSINGDTAECGAFKGASSFLICRRIAGLGKKHHIFDSFLGLSEPGPEDGSYWKKGDLASNENIIRENLKCFDFIVYHKGRIPTKFHEVSNLKFSFVHIDVDLYKPTLDSLMFFYERMSPGGIILCDDYGFLTCPGAKKAIELFFSDKTEEIIHLPTGQGFAIKK